MKRATKSRAGRTMITCSSTTMCKAHSATSARFSRPSAAGPCARANKSAISSRGCFARHEPGGLPRPRDAPHVIFIMSKAFTKETEADEDFEDEIPALPAGLKNYMTPEGLRRLQDEFAQLLQIERPKTVETVAWAAGNGDRSENGDYIYGKKR